MKKIQLIQPTVPDVWEKDIREGCHPPLGLLSIGSYLKKHHHNCEIEILDGNLLDQNELERKIEGDILGITVTTRTYSSARKIAKIGKEIGSYVFFGGHHITAVKDKLFTDEENNIDAAVIYDGEIPFLELVKSVKKEKINNLIYKEKNVIKQTPIKFSGLDSYPTPDYSLVDYKQYTKNYKKVFSKIDPFDKMVAIYSQKGCEWRNKTGGCLFCSRTDIGWRAKNPQKVWGEINYLTKTFGQNILIRDVSDDFMTNLDWFKEFYIAKPTIPNAPLYIQTRTDKINEETIKMLSDIGVYLVCLGIESGDQNMLNRINKGITIEQNINAVKLLKRNGINARITLVLGNPGENENTLNNTFNHVRRLIEIGNIQQLGTYMFQPFPGSRAFYELSKDKNMKNKYASASIDLLQLEKDWIEKYCNVSYEGLKVFSLKIKELVPYADGHGWKINPNGN